MEVMRTILKRPWIGPALLGFVMASQPSLAGEELIGTALMPDGTPVPYLLNSQAPSPRYVVILFPGSEGTMNLRLVDGKPAYERKGNFLIRSRKHIVDDEFSTVSTNSTSSPERIQALLDDLKKRFPGSQIYLIGTSRGTHDTMKLSGYLSTRIAGVVHTASLNAISGFDPRPYPNRHLLVHHKHDACHVSPFSSAQYSHEKFGTELIVMEGGETRGESCKARAFHGFNGIERETIGRIKQWIKRGPTAKESPAAPK
jgi:hypothetical protein